MYRIGEWQYVMCLELGGGMMPLAGPDSLETTRSYPDRSSSSSARGMNIRYFLYWVAAKGRRLMLVH